MTSNQHYVSLRSHTRLSVWKALKLGSTDVAIWTVRLKAPFPALTLCYCNCRLYAVQLTILLDSCGTFTALIVSHMNVYLLRV